MAWPATFITFNYTTGDFFLIFSVLAWLIYHNVYKRPSNCYDKIENLQNTAQGHITIQHLSDEKGFVDVPENILEMAMETTKEKELRGLLNKEIMARVQGQERLSVEYPRSG